MSPKGQAHRACPFFVSGHHQSLPFELGLRQRVSLEKGCYLGQETLAKLHSRDGLKQQLRRFVVADGADAPEPGQQLRTTSGERGALVTSVQGGRGLLLLHRRCPAFCRARRFERRGAGAFRKRQRERGICTRSEVL